MKKFQMFELKLHGEPPSDSAVKIDLSATFSLAGEETTVLGFYDGNRTYCVRFFPQNSGVCTWKIHSSIPLEGCLSGEEMCLDADEERHGVVHTAGLHFRYDDGTRYMPFGTTVYALIHQEDSLVEQTMSSLRESPFNKVRLCLFPKHYDFNHNEPPCFAFEKSEQGEWNMDSPNFAFWHRLEQRIAELDVMGIEADLILFHGYDRWGFSRLSKEQCLTYLDYVTRRLAAYPNIWWSLANEYEILNHFKPEWWHTFAAYLGTNDPWHHLLSCHNFLELWDFDDPNVTHCSIQDPRVIRVPDLQKRYRKPVIFDECCYEGNLPYAWGNLSAFEMVNRFWTASVMGGYCTHGETYLSVDEVLWWAKGGILKGESVPRIAYLRKILESLPGELSYMNGPYEMLLENPETEKDIPENMKEAVLNICALLQRVSPRRRTDFFDQNRLAAGHCGEDVYIQYMGRQCCAECQIKLPENRKYDVEWIDVWAMQREEVLHDVSGAVTVSLPGKEGIAILAKAKSDIYH